MRRWIDCFFTGISSSASVQSSTVNVSGSFAVARPISASVIRSTRGQSLRSSSRRSPKPTLVGFSFGPVRRPRGDDPFRAAPVGVDNRKEAGAGLADNEEAPFFRTAALFDPEDRTGPDFLGLIEVDAVFFKIALAFAFIPSEPHLLFSVAQSVHTDVYTDGFMQAPPHSGLARSQHPYQKHHPRNRPARWAMGGIVVERTHQQHARRIARDQSPTPPM